MSSSQELPRRTDAPLAIPDPNPAFGLDLIAWRSPGALVLRFASPGSTTPSTTEGSPARTVLAAGLLPLGHGPDDVMFVDQADTNFVGRFLDYAFPPTISWDDLPLVGEAQWAWAALPSRRVLPGGTRGRWDVPSRGYGHTPLERAAARDAAVSAETIVLDSPVLDSRSLAEVAEILAMRGGPAPLVLHFDGERLAPLDPAAITAAREEWRAHHRFAWSWMLNAMPGWGTALQAVGARIGMGNMFARSFLTPFSAVTLMEVAKNPEPATDLLSGMWRAMRKAGLDPDLREHRMRFMQDSDERRDAELRARPGLERLPGEIAVIRVRGERGEWTSPPFTSRSGVIRLDRDYDRSVQKGPSGMPLAGAAEFWMMSDASHLGLLGSDDNGRAALTKRGRRFVELLRPAFDDPDLLWRWGGPEGQICMPAHVPAADRWLNHAFRRLRRDLPDAAPRTMYAQDPGTVWNREGTAPANQEQDRDPVHQALVRLEGRHLMVKVERLLDPGFPVDALRKALQDSKSGPNRGSVMTTKRIRIWWGRLSPDIMPAEVAPLPDDMDVGALEALASIPPELLALPETEMSPPRCVSLMIHRDAVAHAMPSSPEGQVVQISRVG